MIFQARAQQAAHEEQCHDDERKAQHHFSDEVVVGEDAGEPDQQPVR